MIDKEPLPFNPQRRKKRPPVPLSYHPRITWLPSQLKEHSEASQQNAIRRTRRNFGEKINIITIHEDPHPGA